MTSQWLPIALALLPLADLGFRLLFEKAFKKVADFQLHSALERDSREKVKEVVKNTALLTILLTYFENGVRIRQVFPILAVATLSVWGSIEELRVKDNGQLSNVWYWAGGAYIALSIVFLFCFLAVLAGGWVKLSRDPSIKRSGFEGPQLYNSIAFAFDVVAIVFAVAAKLSG